ncbi:MAG: SAM-dependent methyltransferase, partial [Porticoccaceae bacterium]
MSNQSIQLTPELYTYLLEVSLRESDLLQELRDRTRQMPEARMQIA